MKVKSVISKTLREKAKVYAEDKNINNTELAKLIGEDRSSFSRYMNENAGELSQTTINRIEESLYRLLEEKESAHIPGGILETRDAQGVMFVCQSSRETRKPGIIYGRAGFGKTYTLQYYAKDPKVIYVVCNEAMNSRDLAKKIEQAIGLPKGRGSVDDRMDTIREFFEINEGYLLIIDEADKLMSRYSYKKIEILRALFDSKCVAMVLAGEPALYSIIKRNIPRLIDRMTFCYRLNGLSHDEAYEYMKGYPIEEEAKETMVRFATNEKDGSFRRFANTFENVVRVAGDNVITMETVAQARSFMI